MTGAEAGLATATPDSDHRAAWPGEKRTAVVFNVAYEAWSDGATSAIGPMGNPLPPGHLDTNALSWGAYGARRGIWRLLEVLDEQRVHATVYVSGCLAERHPETVVAIAEAGHEICGHGYAQDRIPVLLDEKTEREEIKRCRGLLGDLVGAAPAGWVSPRGTPSMRTGEILAEEGFVWHGDYFEDDFPRTEHHAAGSLVAIPLTTQVNDLSLCTRHGNPARALLDQFRDAVQARLGPSRPVVQGHVDVLGHTHVSGRPLESWIYGEIVGDATRRDDLAVMTRGDIAAWHLQTATPATTGERRDTSDQRIRSRPRSGGMTR